METALGPGLVIGGRFRLEAQLGEGSFGSVWRASTIDDAWGDTFALKVLHAQLLTAQHLRERFVLEAEILSRLHHPNIARAVAWSAEPPHPFLALEFIDGTTLHEVLSKGALLERHLTFDEVESLSSQLFAAVSYAHAENVVHRDLKPMNLMIIRQGPEIVLKVLDFGISKVVAATGDSTTVGRMLGTPAYMAPEQIRSEPVDERTDVFALGTILHEMLALERAWIRDHGRPLAFGRAPSGQSGAAAHLEIFARITEGPRPRPTDRRPELPAAIDAVIARATAVSPRDRYRTVAELAAAFRSALHASTAPSFDEESTAGLERTTWRPGDHTQALLTAVLPPYVEDTAPSMRARMEPPPPKRTSFAALAAAFFVLGVSAATFGTVALMDRGTPVTVRTVEAPPLSEPPKAEPAPAPAVEPIAAVPAEPPVEQAEAEPAADRDEPRVRREPRSRARPARPQPAAETAPADTRDPLERRLDALLARVKSNPSDAALAGELSDAIARAAQRVADPGARASIERRATASAAVGDLAGLAACAREVRAALEKRAP